MYNIFYDKLLKFCQMQEYVDDILNGRIYMNELRSFNNTSNLFRDDILDGWRALNSNIYTSARLEWHGESLSLPVEGLKMSYDGIGKIPVFSAAQLDERVIQKSPTGKYKFKAEFISHMRQFGDFVVLINKTELMQKLVAFANTQHVRVLCGCVQYVSDNEALPKAETFEDAVKKFVFAKTISTGREYQL